jgi:hypothetical protein
VRQETAACQAGQPGSRGRGSGDESTGAKRKAAFRGKIMKAITENKGKTIAGLYKSQ